MKVVTRGVFHFVPLATGGGQILFGGDKSPSSWTLLEFHASQSKAWRRFNWLTTPQQPDTPRRSSRKLYRKGAKIKLPRRRAQKRNPVKISKGNGATPFKLYTRSREKPTWKLTAKVYSLAKAISLTMKMKAKGYGVRLTAPRAMVRDLIR